MAGRRWVGWIFPRPWLDAHPLLGGLAVVALFGSAAAYGMLACSGGALTLGVLSTIYAGLANFGTSGRPGCLAQALAWATSAKGAWMHGAAPYIWRWGAVCTIVATGSLAFGTAPPCR